MASAVPPPSGDAPATDPHVLAAALDVVDALVVVLDRAGRILHLNRKALTSTGYRLDEVRGALLWDTFIPPDQRNAAQLAFERLCQGDFPSTAEIDWLTREGRRRRIAWTNTAVRDAAGRVTQIIGTGVDTTDLKQAERALAELTREGEALRRAEEALRLSEARFAGIVGLAAEGIICVDEDQRIVLFNEGAANIFGYSGDEVLGQDLAMLLPERVRGRHRQLIRDFARGPSASRRVNERSPVTGLRRNGEEFPAEASISRLDIEDEQLFTVILRDVTEQRRIEEILRCLAHAGSVMTSPLHHAAILENLADALVRHWADICIIDVIEPQRGVLRVGAAHRDPARQDATERLRHLQLDRNRPHLLGRALRNGSTELVAQLDEATLARHTQSPEHLAALRDLDLHSYITAPLDARGRRLGAILFGTAGPQHRFRRDDLAVASELASRVAMTVDGAQLYHQEREAVRTRDELLGVVSHDLRSPLHMILLATDLLRSGVDTRSENGQQQLRLIRQLVDRMNRLIEGLLNVSAIEAGHLHLTRRSVDLAELARRASDDIRPLAEAKSLQLVVEQLDLLPAVRADPDRLLQVLGNLLGNAAKFTPAGGRITIHGAAEDGQVAVSVTDTGPGIPPDELPHLFDRFWQAQRQRRASAGLGLAIVKEIVEAHGGTLRVASTPGEGATFTFLLPLDPDSPNPGQ